MFVAREPKKYRFPPEPQSKPNEYIYGVVVDKKGDASGFTMKQNELFCYSPSIRKNCGYFVMPKSYWKCMKKGDWFVCIPEYVDHKDPALYEERSLNMIKYIPLERRLEAQLPRTLVHLENVRICEEFIKSPKFIDNNYLGGRSRSDNIHKLVMWQMGTGFFSEKKFPNNSIEENRVYRGVFEFHAPDNGGVNFRPNMKDKYDMPLERDTYWELVEIMDLRYEAESKKGKAVKNVSIGKLAYWVKYLKELEEWTIEYGEKIEVKFLKNSPVEPIKTPSAATPSRRITQSMDLNKGIRRIGGFERTRNGESSSNLDLENEIWDIEGDILNLTFSNVPCSTPKTSPQLQRRRP